MIPPSKTAAIIVAAGRGQRAGSGLPKQWRALGGEPVAARTAAAFRTHPRIDAVVLVIHPDDADQAAQIPGVQIAHGAPTRAQSVLSGLRALEAAPPTHVLIHDVARPLVSARLIDAVLDALVAHPGAAPAIAVTDALWRAAGGTVTETLDRTGVARAQTPQGFDFQAILAAHLAHDGDAADDVAVARAAGLAVALVPGEDRNIKLTWPEDFAKAETLLQEAQTMDIRMGNGFDVHRFGPGEAVVLCGVTIPHGRGLQGHSDADVPMHAVTDAIYGALAEGDIGRHFPPSDPQWRGADSAIFLRHAAELAAARGYRISNIDVTIICERPKIGPHAAAMMARMAEIMGLAPGQVSVKATTSEGLGFTGREEGIAAQASAVLVPAS